MRRDFVCGRVRGPMRQAVFIFVVALTLVGCKSQCRVLSEKQCDCALTTTERTSCLAGVANRETLNPPTPEDEDRCAALIDQCDCRLIDTPQGKMRCGIAN